MSLGVRQDTTPALQDGTDDEGDASTHSPGSGDAASQQVASSCQIWFAGASPWKKATELRGARSGADRDVTGGDEVQARLGFEVGQEDGACIVSRQVGKEECRRWGEKGGRVAGGRGVGGGSDARVECLGTMRREGGQSERGGHGRTRVRRHLHVVDQARMGRHRKRGR